MHEQNDMCLSLQVNKTKRFYSRGTITVLHGDVWSRIVPYVDSETLPALACTGKTTHHAVVFRDVVDGRFSLLPTTEHLARFERAREGFVRLLRENSAKSVDAAFRLVGGSIDKNIAEFRRLWRMSKLSLPDGAVTYDDANSLGAELRKKGQFEEAKLFWGRIMSA